MQMREIIFFNRIKIGVHKYFFPIKLYLQDVFEFRYKGNTIAFNDMGDHSTSWGPSCSSATRVGVQPPSTKKSNSMIFDISSKLVEKGKKRLGGLVPKYRLIERVRRKRL